MKTSIAGACLALMTAFAAPAAAQNAVGLATSSAGSFYHTQGSIIASALAEKNNIQMRVQPFASPNIHLPAINAGQMEFGLANIFEVGLAIKGEDFFNGRKNPDLRLVTITSPLRTGLFVRKDSPIKTIADLKGKRIPWRYAQQNIIMPLMLTHFDAYDITEKDITTVPVPTVVRGADEFMAGRVDMFLFALGSAKTTEVDAAVGGIRILPLPDNEATQAAIKKHFPASYIETVQPRQGLAGVVEPTPIQAYDGVMVTNAKASEELVYNVTKALWENAEALAKGSPTLADFKTERMAKKTPDVEYHPGAIKFYKEKGVWPPK
ncbi:MAG TPA: TAXI family TRAP transporter solute-binding subunit [Beijerinckiaceae bacterium]|jgi:TRAP transporter TAXI family solute receptor